jgi:hypothetical protein
MKVSCKTIFFLCAFCATTAITSPEQTLKSLVSFNGAKAAITGSWSLVQGLDGNFYGTTNSGGANDRVVARSSAVEPVLKTTPSGEVTRLYSSCA